MIQNISRFLYLFSIIAIFESNLYAQPTDITANSSLSGQTFSTCNGVLYASGGVSGTGYQNGENWIITICPDTPGDAISLDFITFNLSTQNTATPPANNADNFCIYDGNSTSSTSLGCYGGTGLQGLIVSCTSFNTSGCLTIEFHSNSAGTGNFAANVTCTTPCTRPTAGLVAPIPVAPDTCFKICVGDALSFDGSSSFAAPGFSIDQYLWNFDDGTLDSTSGAQVTHTFNDQGEFLVDLFIFDNNGCAATNLVTVQVLVGTTPTFTGTTSDTSICLGESVCLDGVVTGTLYTGTPGAVSTSAYLPDDVGQCFESTITYNIFNPGQNITNINQIIDICVTMEHSFMGDLVASIICPNGQSVVLHQQGGGGTSLGEPVDINGPSDPMGIPYTYCWSDNAPNGTWVDCAAFGPTPNVMNLPPPNNFVQTLIPGTYSSLNPLSGLVGCPLNGTWILEFCDLWGADDGWITDWSVNFDPGLIPNVTQFTPQYGPNCDSTFWTGDNAAATSQISSTSSDCNNICITPNAVGTYSYTFNATDDFGCTYTTTTVVTVTPGPDVDAGPDQTVCTNVATQLNATTIGIGTTCNYTLNLYDSFGDGWNGANFNIYINGVLFGNYTMNNGTFISYTVSIPAGATIDIEYFPGAWENEVTYEIIDCSGNIIFNDGPNPLTGIVYSGLNGLDIVYSWTPTTGLSDPNIANPIATVNQQTTYYVTAYENGHPLCGTTDSVTLFIDPAVNAGTDSSITVCNYASPFDLFSQLGGTPVVTGSWFDAVGNAVSNMFDPNAFTPGSYTLTYIVPSNGACPPDSANVEVTVLDPLDVLCCPYSYTTTLTDVTCFGQCDGVVLIDATAPAQFSIDDGVTFSSDSTFNNLCSGTYDVVVQFANGCEHSSTEVINSPDSIIANFTFSPIVSTVLNTNVSFTNLSVGAVSYYWDFGFTTSNDIDPTVVFPDDTAGIYNVCLYAYNAVNCPDSVCFDVTINEGFVIYVPNSFTPNGDGMNDVFHVYGNDISSVNYQLLIFNRWGELIFETTQFGNGWDGTVKGLKAPNDVYVWRLKAESTNAENYFDKVGSVTLVR